MIPKMGNFWNTKEVWPPTKKLSQLFFPFFERTTCVRTFIIWREYLQRGSEQHLCKFGCGTASALKHVKLRKTGREAVLFCAFRAVFVYWHHYHSRFSGTCFDEVDVSCFLEGRTEEGKGQRSLRKHNLHSPERMLI